MEIINRVRVRVVINVLLGIWIGIWLYFMALNWQIFTVKININAGFAVFQAYPFVLFFLLGLGAIIAIRYLLQYTRMLRKIEEKEKNNKIAMQEKDIEILQLKELLYKTQSSELNKSATNIDALHTKIDKIIEQFQKEKSNTADDRSEMKKDKEE